MNLELYTRMRKECATRATPLEGMDDRGLVQWLILLAVFDGNPFRWKSYLASRGSDAQRKDDGEFVRGLCDWLTAGQEDEGHD